MESLVHEDVSGVHAGGCSRWSRSGCYGRPGTGHGRRRDDSRGASLDESCAFLAAIAVQQDLLGDGALLARLAFVDDLSTWRLLLESPAPLALVPMNAEFAHEVPADTHHTVLVPLTEVRIADVELPPLDAARVSAALLAAGMEDERKADEAGRLARRSLTALRRHLAQNMALHRPTWAVPPISRHIRAGLLAGSWKDEREGDRDILSRLAGEGYDGFREAASGLAVEADPFITRVGGSWHLVSAVDAWLLLVDRLTGDDLKRFESVLLTVLGEEDPALDVPEKERWWKASFEGKVRTFSADLRRGLARSLALLGVHGDAIPLPGGSSGSTRASYLVRSLLKGANGDTSGRKWASLSELLPLLAEAAPDEFLDAVAAGAKGADPVLAKMFTDQENTGLFSSYSPTRTCCGLWRGWPGRLTTSAERSTCSLVSARLIQAVGLPTGRSAAWRKSSAPGILRTRRRRNVV